MKKLLLLLALMVFMTGAVSAKEGRVKHDLSRKGAIDRRYQDQNAAADDRNGDQRIAQKGRHLAQDATQKQASEKDRKKTEGSPDIIIPKIAHDRLRFSRFCVGDRG